MLLIKNVGRLRGRGNLIPVKPVERLVKEKPVKISSKKTFPGSKFELQITGGKCRPDPEIPIFEIPMPIPVPD